MSTERAIRIEADGVRVYAILAATPVAEAIWDALPLQGTVRRSESAIRFDVDLSLSPGAASPPAPALGSMLYLPQGPSIALVFGDAPAGAGWPPAASRFSPFGRITGDAARLGRAREGGRITLTRLDG